MKLGNGIKLDRIKPLGKLKDIDNLSLEEKQDLYILTYPILKGEEKKIFGTEEKKEIILKCKNHNLKHIAFENGILKECNIAEDKNIVLDKVTKGFYPKAKIVINKEDNIEPLLSYFVNFYLQNLNTKNIEVDNLINFLWLIKDKKELIIKEIYLKNTMIRQKRPISYKLMLSQKFLLSEQDYIKISENVCENFDFMKVLFLIETKKSIITDKYLWHFIENQEISKYEGEIYLSSIMFKIFPMKSISEKVKKEWFKMTYGYLTEEELLDSFEFYGIYLNKEDILEIEKKKIKEKKRLNFLHDMQKDDEDKKIELSKKIAQHNELGDRLSKSNNHVEKVKKI